MEIEGVNSVKELHEPNFNRITAEVALKLIQNFYIK